MTIVLGTGNLGQERSQLPASRDRAAPDLPLRDNPFGAAANLSSNSTPEDEGLIGIYPYSGCDIKLVVHLPPEDPRDSGRQLDEMEQELRLLVEASEMASTEEELTQAESRLASLRGELENTHQLISILHNGGDIGDVATQEELESDVEDLNEQVAELVGIIHTSPRADQRSEMQTQIETLTRSIESVREGSPTPPTSRTKVLAEVQTLSISSHREKYPVRPLGTVFLRSVTRGPRCIPASESILVKDRGYLSIADIIPGDYVQSSSNSYNRVVDSWFQGEKFCYKLKLQDGYELTASFDHPISTPSGWKTPQELKIGDLVYIVGKTPSRHLDLDISDDLIKMTAFLIGDGTTHIYNKTHKIGLCIADSENSFIGVESQKCLEALGIPFRDNKKEGSKCFDRIISVCKIGKSKTDWAQREYNSLHNVLQKWNMYGRYSYQKIIPDELLCGMSTRQIKLFLRYLFATDGCYSISQDLKYIEAKYDSTSEKLIDQIRLLLSKLGISSIKVKDSVLKGTPGGLSRIVSKHNCHRLVISSACELVKFVSIVGILGKDCRILNLIPLLKSRIRNKYISLSRKEFRFHVNNALSSKGLPVSDICQKYNLYSSKSYVTPRMAIAIAKEVNLPELTSIVDEQVNNIIFENHENLIRPVTKIEPVGLLPVYDLEVENRHTFIVNFIPVHNTVSGSMVFTTFHNHIMHEFLESAQYRSTGVGDWDRFAYSSHLMDQIPPLDISISFANEYGNLSWMAVLGVEFMNEGLVMSIEDLFLEGTTQYIARDFDPIRSVANRRMSRTHGIGRTLTGTSIMARDFRRRAANRNIPWI